MASIETQETATGEGVAARALRFAAAFWLAWLFAGVSQTVIFILLIKLRATPPLVMATSTVMPPSIWSASIIYDARLVCFEIAASLALVCCTAIAIAFMLLVARLIPASVRARRGVYFSGRILILWFVVTGYILSWGAYLSDGSFIDRGSIFFWLQLTHPFTLLFWSSPTLLCCLPVGSLAVAVVGDRSVNWITRKLPARRRGQIVVAGVLVAGIVAGFGCFDEKGGRASATANDRELLAAANTNPQKFWSVRRYKLGPSATALLDLADIGSDDDTPPAPGADVPVVYRPVISQSTYLKNVDRSAMKRWNVVFVEVESMRADALRIFGATRDIMPTVDQLSRESLAFDHAYTQVTHSNYAVGCPLASQYPLRSNRQYGFPSPLPYPHVMIDDILKWLGYRVAFVDSGNDTWFGMRNYLITPAIDFFQDAESWHGKTIISSLDSGFAAWAKQTRHHGIVDDAITMKTALDWVDRQPPGPFFLYLNFQASHFPYLVPDDFQRRFSDGRVDFDMTFEHYPVNKAATVRDRYDDSLRYVDAQLGKLVAYLKSKQLLDQTIIVLTGDHGQAFYEHGFVTHANMLYNELVRVPLIIRVPGMPARLMSDPVQHIDVPPMLLHLMHLPPHPAFQGVDPLGSTSSTHRLIYMMVNAPLAEQYAALQDGFKLIFDQRSQTLSMFDEGIDPSERHDVLATEQGRAEAMLKRLDTWRYAQLNYYRNPLLQKQCYAPFFPDP